MTKNRTLLRKNPGKQIQNMDFPIVGSKIKVSKIQDQWGNNWLNPTNLVREKSQKPSEVPSVVVSDGALEMVNCLIAAALLKHLFAS